MHTWTDDTSLTQITDTEQEQPEIGVYTLNEDLVTLANWTSLWHVKFNPGKAAYFIFRHHHKIMYTNLLMNNQPLSRVSSHTPNLFLLILKF